MNIGDTRDVNKEVSRAKSLCESAAIEVGPVQRDGSGSRLLGRIGENSRALELVLIDNLSPRALYPVLRRLLNRLPAILLGTGCNLSS